MDKYKVSVIIPCYNGELYLKETLDSVLEQTLWPIEIIVVDDGSTDGSARIAENYRERVKVIRQKNKGESSARNKGIKFSSAEYLLFLDADDLLDKHALEKLYQAAVSKKKDVACMGVAYFNNGSNETYYSYCPYKKDFLPSILTANFAPPHCWIIKKDIAVRAGGFTEEISILEDWDFWCKVAFLDSQITFINYIGAYYRRHSLSQSLSGPKRERVFASALIIERNFKRIKNDLSLYRLCGDTLFWAAINIYDQAKKSGYKHKDLFFLKNCIIAIANNKSMKGTPSILMRFIKLTGFNLPFFLWSKIAKKTS